MLQEKEKSYAEDLMREYSPEKKTDLDTLRALDRKVKQPAQIVAYTLGIIGALILGVGMCLAMKVIGELRPLGIVIGVVGIAIVVANYFIYKAILKKRSEKYSDEIVRLSNKILND